MRGTDSTHKSRRRKCGMDSTLILTVRERGVVSFSSDVEPRAEEIPLEIRPTPHVIEFESLAERIHREPDRTVGRNCVIIVLFLCS